MGENGEVVTRAKIYCPEACILTQRRRRCKRGQGLRCTRHCLCHRAGSLRGASYKLGRGGVMSLRPFWDVAHLTSEFGPQYLASSRYCSPGSQFLL